MTLGVIPKVEQPGNVETKLVDPRSALAEAHRSLCTALQFSTETGLPTTLLVTSAMPSEGKSITALSIARHFSIMGLKVLIVDADLRNASLHKWFGLDNSVGLTNYLTSNCSPPNAIQRTDLVNLFFMSSGPLAPNAADLLASSRLRSLLSVGSEMFELIVIDGPPVIGIADALLLSNAAAATVFVIAAGQTRIGPVRNALKRLKLARAPIIGAIINKINAKTAGYGYGYGHDYSKDGKNDSGDKLEETSGKGRRQFNKTQDAS